jgi:hypothetical protein
MDNDRLPGLPGHEYRGTQPDMIIYDELGPTPQRVTDEQRMLNHIEGVLRESVGSFIETMPTENLMVAIRNGYNSLINSGDIVNIISEQNPDNPNVLDVTIQTRARAEAPIDITLNTSSTDKVLEKVNAFPRVYNESKDIHWGMWYFDKPKYLLKANASWQCNACGFRAEYNMAMDVFFVNDDVVIENTVNSHYISCIKYFDEFKHNHENESNDTDMLDHVVL